jgi:hypothetical protein
VKALIAVIKELPTLEVFTVMPRGNSILLFVKWTIASCKLSPQS